MSQQYLAITGREQHLSIAELESIGLSVDKINDYSVLLTSEIKTPNHLGGVIKIAEVLLVSKHTDWPKISRDLAVWFKEVELVDGKRRIGLSLYGLDVDPKQLNGWLLAQKKSLRNRGQSVRIVNTNTTQLNAAHLKANKLTSNDNLELLVSVSGSQTVVAKTIWYQDIDEYAARDHARPKRDAQVGMLPPKLAQIMLNLAIGAEHQPKTVLDPFCGTGVLLQEAMLIGHNVVGTDISSRMINYSQENLDWLKTTYSLSNSVVLGKADARSHQWSKPIDAVVSEIFLGEALSSAASPEKIRQLQASAGQLIQEFLSNIAAQLDSGTPLVLAIPAWQTKRALTLVSNLDSLEEIGYTQPSFQQVDANKLIYARPDQFVARQLLRLKRK